MTKIGVFAGTFDPIHLGHTGFIEQSIEKNGLNKVLLLIEKNPRFKTCLADYEQRRKMAQLAIADNSRIEIYETDYDDFPLSHCLPKIRAEHEAAELFLLLGNDVAEHIKTWPGFEQLLSGIELIIGERAPASPSSVKVRENLRILREKSALHKDVYHYIRQSNLYQ